MHLTLIAAQSLDGFITRHDEPGSAFASEADRRFFRAALDGFDCCVLGATSYRVERERIRKQTMPQRLRVVVTRSPGAFAEDARPGSLEFSNAAPTEIVAGLRDRGFKRCALLGGSQIHGLFLGAGLVDELWITLEPRLFGSGTPLVSAQTDVRLRLLATEPLSADTLLLKYQVLR